MIVNKKILLTCGIWLSLITLIMIVTKLDFITWTSLMSESESSQSALTQHFITSQLSRYSNLVLEQRDLISLLNLDLKFSLFTNSYYSFGWHSIMFWFSFLFAALPASWLFLEEKSKGIASLMMVRLGKWNYFKRQLIFVIALPILLVFLAGIIDYLTSFILFYRGEIGNVNEVFPQLLSENVIANIEEYYFFKERNVFPRLLTFKTYGLHYILTLLSYSLYFSSLSLTIYLSTIIIKFKDYAYAIGIPFVIHTAIINIIVVYIVISIVRLIFQSPDYEVTYQVLTGIILNLGISTVLFSRIKRGQIYV